jgi:predicted RecB family nuclease
VTNAATPCSIGAAGTSCRSPSPGRPPVLPLRAAGEPCAAEAYPDFLVQSRAGSTVYRPEDAKLARKPKGEHLLQLGIYAELLEQRFGAAVQDGVVHVATADPVSFDLRRTRYILKRLVRAFERFVGDKARVTKSQPCAACAQCDYKPRCEAEWRSADSPFFVAGVSGAQLVKLWPVSTRCRNSRTLRRQPKSTAWARTPLRGLPGKPLDG